MKSTLKGHFLFRFEGILQRLYLKKMNGKNIEIRSLNIHQNGIYQPNSYIVELQGVLAGNSGGKKFQGCRNSM